MIHHHIPKDFPSRQDTGQLFRHIKSVFSSPPAAATLLISLLAAFASEIVSLVFGVWLEESFGLQVIALGGAAAVIGFAELSGESLVVFITDRLGKVRAVALGLTGSMLSVFLLPILGTSVTGALISLFLFYLCFEFMFVSLVPLMTEVLPEARATLMALGVTSYSTGRWAATWITPTLYALGFPAVAGTAGVIYLLSWLVLRRVKIATDG